MHKSDFVPPVLSSPCTRVISSPLSSCLKFYMHKSDLIPPVLTFRSFLLSRRCDIIHDIGKFYMLLLSRCSFITCVSHISLVPSFWCDIIPKCISLMLVRYCFDLIPEWYQNTECIRCISVIPKGHQRISGHPSGTLPDFGGRSWLFHTTSWPWRMLLNFSYIHAHRHSHAMLIIIAMLCSLS